MLQKFGNEGLRDCHYNESMPVRACVIANNADSNRSTITTAASMSPRCLHQPLQASLLPQLWCPPLVAQPCCQPITTQRRPVSRHPIQAHTFCNKTASAAPCFSPRHTCKGCLRHEQAICSSRQLSDSQPMPHTCLSMTECRTGDTPPLCSLRAPP